MHRCGAGHFQQLGPGMEIFALSCPHQIYYTANYIFSNILTGTSCSEKPTEQTFSVLQRSRDRGTCESKRKRTMQQIDSLDVLRDAMDCTNAQLQSIRGLSEKDLTKCMIVVTEKM